MSSKPSFDFQLQSDEAIKYLEQKGFKLSFNYEEMMHEAHHRAFTVAKVTQIDLLQEIRESLIKAQQSGEQFEEWKTKLEPTLKKRGWLGQTVVTSPVTGETKEIFVGSKRLKNIFETNMQTSYQMARHNAMLQLDSAVYWRYVSALLENTRTSHAAMHGIILHRDDPFWHKNYPPNDWNCKCKVVAYTKAQIDARGWSVHQGKIAPVASKDWAYDTGSSSIAFYNYPYSKALSKINGCAEKNALGDVCGWGKKVLNWTLSALFSSDKQALYKSFVSGVLGSKSYAQNQVIAGSMSFEVFEFLSSKEIIPASASIVLTKKALTHMTRDSKSNALSISQIESIPQTLKNPEKILFDKNKKNVLYLFDIGEKTGKVVVEVNYKTNKGSINTIVTTGIVSSSNINSQMYELIVGEWE